MPHATVAALITHPDRSDRILLARRAHRPFLDHWCLPGGHIEPYETAEDAVRREVQEETGLAFAPTFLTYSEELFAELGLHYVALVFAGPGSGQLRAQDGEVAELRWCSLSEAAELPMAFRHAEVLATYAARMHTNVG